LSVEFHGNIGAEAPCITVAGHGVLERVEFAPILFPAPRQKIPHYMGHSRLRHFLTITGRGGGAGGLP
jgi:hypothetical protein